MHRLLTGLAALSAVACTSLEDVRQQPFSWFSYYPVPFDNLANCLAARSAQLWTVTPQIQERQGIAYVTLGEKGGSSVVAEYVVWRQADGSSLVGWRRRKIIADVIGLQSTSREAADRCGRERRTDNR